MGYRKVSFLEQILYVIEAAMKKRWKWIFGGTKEAGE